MYSISDVSSDLKSYYYELKLDDFEIESILKIYSDNTFFIPGIKEKGSVTKPANKITIKRIYATIA